MRTKTVTGKTTLCAAALLLAATLACGSARGGLIVAETGGGSIADLNYTLASSWTQSGTFHDVSIAAELVNLSGPQSFDAWLTTAIGSGATSATQVATTSVSAGSGASDTTIFSGLTLGPGTYYLVMDFIGSPPTNAAIEATASSVAASDVGATLGPSYFGGSTVSPYKPSTGFIPLYGQSLIFSVQGVQAVPEPSTLRTAAGAVVPLLGAWLLRRRAAARRSNAAA
jgi:hypothetical protein